MKTKSNTKANSIEHAHGYCLFILGLRLRTEGEIREKMKGRGYLPEIIDQEVTELKANKYVDDERFAEIFTDNMKKYKNYGYYQVKKKLIEKRLPEQTIQHALDEYFTIPDEIKVGQKFLKKSLLTEKKDFKTKQKIAQKLRTRGFRSEVIGNLIA